MDLLFLSSRIFLGSDEGGLGFMHGGIIVSSDGIIRRILRSAGEVNSYIYNTESEAVYDFENMVLMPGLIDANVHIGEPGRKDWEGFHAATQAAAAGGFTTIIDRPINAIPPTITAAALKAKASLARGKIYVDVGFWGGLVPQNSGELDALMGAGAIGLQCTLSPTPNPVGEQFPAMNQRQLAEVLPQLEDGTLVAFSAELLPATDATEPNNEEPRKYETFLRTRPPQLEVNAVRAITQLAITNKTKHLHILNVSSADALPLIAEGKEKGGDITAETCPHYLTLSSEQIDDCHTEFKTHPPIRAKSNQHGLWEALKNGGLDMVTSDHSPATPGPKCLTYGSKRGNFLNAWPGISSLQLGLSIMWTHCHQHGIDLKLLYQLMCERPASLCGMSQFKGKIQEGYDADFCVWDPDEEFTVSPDMLFSSVKTTPYMGQRLRGVVHATVVRGFHVYQKYEGFGQPLGKVLLRKSSKKIVKIVRI